MRLKAARKSKPSAAQASGEKEWTGWRKIWTIRGAVADKDPLTVYGQVKITAVKLVSGGNLTSVPPGKVGFRCNDLHLESVDLPHEDGVESH